MSGAVYKMYCVYAMDAVAKMNGNRGKLASMAGHAYLHSFWDAIARFPEAAEAYRNGRAYKITTRVETVDELHKLEERYRDICGVSLVVDAGKTVFGEPTTACLGIGPLNDDQKEGLLSSLKVLI